LRYFLKVPEDVQSVTNWGRLFHARGPATAKRGLSLLYPFSNYWRWHVPSFSTYASGKAGCLAPGKRLAGTVTISACSQTPLKCCINKHCWNRKPHQRRQRSSCQG